MSKKSTAQKAREKAQASSDRVEAMTEAERRAEIAKCGEMLNRYAPTMESATSDLLAVLQAVGAEFVRRYYPDATNASFHISRYAENGPTIYSVMLPMSVPTRSA